MQGVDSPLITVFVIAFLTLYGTLTWGLFRYSKKSSYRFWAFGWVIYSIGGIQSALSPQNLVPFDVLGLTCFYVGSTLILDGTRSAELTQHRVVLYFTGVLIILLATLTSIALSLPYYLIFGVLGLQIAYVCLLSARTVYGSKGINDMPRAWLILGLLIWAASWLIYPLVIVLPSSYYDFVVALQAAGVIVAGASMLTFFMMNVTYSLEQQYQISQIMSSLIQHDIRNYIQVSRSTLELIQGSSPVEKQYIELASETLEDASLFINEMCDLTSALARMNDNYELASLSSIVAHAVKRVQKEYSLEYNQIEISISESTMIRMCPLIKEIVWNIFDNAFKHGSKVLYVKECSGTESEVILEISDRGGGLPTDIKDFLNSPDSLSRPVAPGFGLGIILIHGLSIICGADYHVEDVIEDSKVLGTKYTIIFATK